MAHKRKISIDFRQTRVRYNQPFAAVDVRDEAAGDEKDFLVFGFDSSLEEFSQRASLLGACAFSGDMGGVFAQSYINPRFVIAVEKIVHDARVAEGVAFHTEHEADDIIQFDQFIAFPAFEIEFHRLRTADVFPAMFALGIAVFWRGILVGKERLPGTGIYAPFGYKIASTNVYDRPFVFAAFVGHNTSARRQDRDLKHALFIYHNS